MDLLWQAANIKCSVQTMYCKGTVVERDKVQFCYSFLTFFPLNLTTIVFTPFCVNKRNWLWF